MSAVRFMEQVLLAKTPDDLAIRFCSAIGDMGYDRINCTEGKATTVSRGIPQDWAAHFTSKVARGTDPVNARLLRGIKGPIILSEMEGLTQAESYHMAEAAQSGLVDGAVFPLRYGPGDPALLTIASSNDGVSPRADLDALFSMAVQFHVAHRLLSKDARFDVKLTPREIDILSWSLQGKSKWAIGEILLISEHGVDFHLRNIYRKLGVTSRVQAVAKAVALGLIHP